jgi:phosphonate transport system substrate-binding protein
LYCVIRLRGRSVPTFASEFWPRNTAVSAIPAASSKHCSPHRTLRCATFLAYHLFWLYKYIADALAERLDCSVELVQGSCYEDLGTDFDLAFVCGLAYVVWGKETEPLVAPVLTGKRYQGVPIYFSDVVVRCDSRFHSFADLRNTTWVYNEPYSQSGSGIVRFHLAQSGYGHSFFGRELEAGSHEAALQLVVEGEADVAAIDSHVLDTLRFSHPHLAASLRVIHTLGPSPIQPLVAARHLPEVLKMAVRSALGDLANDPKAQRTLRRGHVACIVPVQDSTYDPIREMQAVAKGAERKDRTPLDRVARIVL